MEWLKRLGAAIDYIEENLDKEISYDEAAHMKSRRLRNRDMSGQKM